MTTIEILEPAGRIQKLAALQITPITSLKGRRLAIVDNAKPNFQRLATLVAEKLREEYGLGDIRHFRKENPAVGAGAELLDEIARSADIALTGSAD